MATRSTISRRTFLAAAGAAPLAPLALGTGPFQRTVPVGIELYSVRDELAKDLMGTVRRVAAMGYQVVEFYSPYFQWTPAQASDVRKLMDDLGIRCRSTHNDASNLAGDNLQKAIELNRTIGSQYLVMASAGRVTGVDGWKGIAGQLASAADTLRPLGMATGFHNHQTEWMPVDGQRPMDILATNTPQDVVLQLDVGTCVEAGANPVEWITSHPGRIRSVHCKDWAPGAGKGYAVLFGEGVSPWAQIFHAAETVGGVEYYLIEQEQGPAAGQFARAEACLANWKKLRA
jgi:sugar phosphate isomerase/epimerase